jgi:hypothetical protein
MVVIPALYYCSNRPGKRLDVTSPFRRRERAMQRFRSKKTLQKFSSIHGQVHNHFNQERHLVGRQETEALGRTDRMARPGGINVANVFDIPRRAR